MKTKEKMKSRAGFTLVELVVVIAVLAILAGVGAVAYRGYITRAQEAKDLELLSAVKTAVDAATAEDEKGPVTQIIVKPKSDGTIDATCITISPDEINWTNESALFTTFFEGNEKATLSAKKDASGASKIPNWQWEIVDGEGKWTSQ